MFAPRILRTLLLLALTLVVTPSARAEINVWVDYEQAGALGLAQLLETQGNQNQLALNVLDLADYTSRTQHSQQLDVVIGRRALQTWINAPGKGRILGLLVTRYDWQALFSQHPDLKTRATALHSDPNLEQQIALAKAIIPTPQRIGILVHKDAESESLTRLSAQDTTGQIQILRSSGQATLMRDLASLLEQSDVLIAIPDARLYGPQNFRHVLLSAYRQRKPVIGFSGAGVRAGCLVAPYISGPDLARITLDRITELQGWPAMEPLPDAIDIPASEIRVNKDVAEALGLQWLGSIGTKP